MWKFRNYTKQFTSSDYSLFIMYPFQQIHQALITLEVGNATALFILLTREGVIQRKGDGNPEHTALPLAQGISHEGHFEALMMTIPEELFHYTGVRKMEGMAGTECRLTIIFQAKDGTDYSFRVVYGSESAGPPIELAQVLINAVKITESWYAAQQAESLPTNKKWWQVWK